MTVQRRIHARLIVATTSLILAATVSAAGPSSDPRFAAEIETVRVGSNRNANMVVTFNIYGAKGNTAYNTNIAAPFPTNNTVQSRAIARGAYLHGIALQEVCSNQHYWIDSDLDIYGGGNWSNSYWVARAPTLGIGGSIPAGCGSWYGNAVFIRGPRNSHGAAAFSPSTQTSSMEVRGWVCATSYLTMCSSHVTNAGGFPAAAQSAEFRNVAQYVAGAHAPLTAFAGADFNLTPDPGGWMFAWTWPGFKESDTVNAWESTTDWGAAIDFIWKSGSNWRYDAWVNSHQHSDHHWKQGYF